MSFQRYEAMESDGGEEEESESEDGDLTRKTL